MKSTLLAVVVVMSIAVWAGDNATESPLPLPTSGNVTLTLAEYNRLIELASKPLHKPEEAPIFYALKRADLKFRVGETSVTGTVQIEGETYKKGVTKVSLTNGMTILDARQAGKPLPLEQESGRHTAMIAGPSEFSVALDAGLPLNIEAGRASFTLPVPSAGSVRLSLVIPGDHSNLRISPGLITGRSSENGKTTIEATLVPGQPANIYWATREIAAPTVPREAHFLSEVKTLVSVGEGEMRVAALADINVLQGEPNQFEVKVPEGFEVTAATGATLESSEVQSGVLQLRVSGGPRQKNHQFLIVMERSLDAPKAAAPFLSFKGAQRETGEVLVEGSGTMELTATEGGGLKRMDVKETSPYLRGLSHFPMQAAFRFHRQPGETPTLALEWVRFPDSSVLAAVAEHAVVTTLVTSEGRSLTEVKLTIKNQAQPFLKVGLPSGVTILSAEVEGEKVKPVEGPDGNRVPLLRPGFRPTSAYTVSFVFMHSGAPFAKKGGSDLILPKMDVPISVLEWEVFLPQQYQVKDFGGDAISAALVPGSVINLITKSGTQTFNNLNGAAVPPPPPASAPVSPGQIGGVVTDPTGAVVPGARVTVTNLENGSQRIATTASDGSWILTNIPAGRVKVQVALQGFQTATTNFEYSPYQPRSLDMKLSVASANTIVEVQSESSLIDGLNPHRYDDHKNKKTVADQEYAASANVTSLQKRVSGVLPVSVDVPHAGNSYRFVRPLVLDEETKVTFSYKTK